MKRSSEDAYNERLRRREIFDESAEQIFLVIRGKIPLNEIKKLLRNILSKVPVQVEAKDPLDVCRAIHDFQLQEKCVQRLIFDQLVFGLRASLHFKYSTEEVSDFIRLAIQRDLSLPDQFDMDAITSIVMELRQKYLGQSN